MRGMIRVVCVTAMLGWPIAAAAQGTSAFDGIYRGISLTVEKSGGAVARCPAPSSPTPPTLIIANGTARAGPFEGIITPQGVLRLKTERAFVVEGQVDPQGSVEAQGSGTLCVWNYVWQKSR
jgi:hypothetical protein